MVAGYPIPLLCPTSGRFPVDDSVGNLRQISAELRPSAFLPFRHHAGAYVTAHPTIPRLYFPTPHSERRSKATRPDNITVSWPGIGLKMAGTLRQVPAKDLLDRTGRS